MMIRKAFIMKVNPGHKEEYQRRHEPIWPELESVLKSHGVHSYSIFLDPEANTLFAYVEFEDEAQWDSIAKTDVCQRWWKHMADIMPSNPDNSPVSKELKQMFQLR
jgi:L-rhamnose mutarotase